MGSWLLGLIGAASILALLLLVFFFLHLLTVVTGAFNKRKDTLLLEKQIQVYPKDYRLPVYSFKEINKFSEGFSNKIGTGSTNTVFKGILADGTEIAIKRPNTELVRSHDAEARSKFQLELLSRIRHQHLVNLLGYSEHAGCRILIFQYAPNGTLYEHLHGYEHLTWKQRMRIISGIAYGLAYLHHSCDPPIIHGNLRSSNILLTEDYASKINGLGKVPILGGSELVTIRKPGGSFDSGNLGKAIHSRAGDVYAFGVLVLEVISGRLPFSEQTGILVQWASNILKNNERRMELADPSISDVSKPELFAVSEVARRCILQDPERRPAMKEVVETVGEELKIAMEMAAPATSPLTLRGLLDIP